MPELCLGVKLAGHSFLKTAASAIAAHALVGALVDA
jgi:hypothetical protein